LTQGFVLLCDREKRKVHSFSRGATFSADPSFEAAEKHLYKSFQCAEERRLGPMSVTFITDPQQVFPQTETGFSVNTALLISVDSSLLGLVGLGITLAQTGLDEDERKLLRSLAANFMVLQLISWCFSKTRAPLKQFRP